MLGAPTTKMALKIFERRKVQRDSLERISNDPFLTQIGMSLLPGVLDPINFIPVGGWAAKAGKAYKVLNWANRLKYAGGVAAEGAIIGAGSNIASEALIGAQGMETNYYGAGAMGLIFGGTIGFAGGLIFGPMGKNAANGLAPDTDRYVTDFNNDPSLTIDSTAGNVKFNDGDIQSLHVYWWDRLPLIKNFRSDVHILAQSKNPTAVRWSAELAPWSVSLRDKNGNPIPQGTTVYDSKLLIQNNTYHPYRLAMHKTYTAAKQAGYQGKQADFLKEMDSIYVRAMSEQEMAFDKWRGETIEKEYAAEVEPQIAALQERLRKQEIVETTYIKEVEKLNQKFDEKFAKMEEEFLSNYEVDFKKYTDNDYLAQAAEARRKYYSQYLEEGKARGVDELKNISKEKIYRPRLLDTDKIAKLSTQELKERAYEALKSHPANSKLDEKTLDKVADHLVDVWKTAEFNSRLPVSTPFTVGTLPYETYLKLRKLKIDESKLGDILLSDPTTVDGIYNYKMSGSLALKGAYKTDNPREIIKMFRDEALQHEEKLTTDEELALNRLLEDIAGTLQLNKLMNSPAWKFARNLRAFNTMRFGGQFGIAQTVELLASTMWNGIRTTFRTGQFGKSLKEAGGMLFRGREGDKLSERMLIWGFMEEVLSNDTANKIADAEMGLNANTFERGLQNINSVIMKYNGLRMVQASLERYTGATVIQHLIDLSKKPFNKLSDSEKAMLARWGIDSDSLKSLGKELDKNIDLRNNKFNIDKLSKDNLDRLQLAISRGVREVALQSDSIHVPGWMKDSQQMFTKLFTQYMLYPIIGQETLLRRGITEDRAKWLGSVLASVSSYMMLKYLEEQAAVALGFKDSLDTKYDYFGPDGDAALQRGLLKGLNYAASLGVITEGYNRMMAAAGHEQLGQDWTSRGGDAALVNVLGPSAGTAADFLSISQAAVNGELGGERNIMKAKTFLPGLNFPVLNEWSRSMIEEYF